ncbi:MAG: DUF4168 domain-containing protein [Bacteroidota bacterium]
MLLQTMKKFTSLVLIILISSITGIFAQTNQENEISKKELKQFASAFKKVQVIDQKAQANMVTAVEEEGLEVQRYNEIQQAQQDPDQEVDATPEELNKYETASEELETIREQARQQMHEKIIDEGFSINRYQEIAVAIQNDPELQQKLQEYLQG